MTSIDSLFSTYNPRLLRFLTDHMPDPTDWHHAEDLAQDAWLTLLDAGTADDAGDPEDPEYGLPTALIRAAHRHLRAHNPPIPVSDNGQPTTLTLTRAASNDVGAVVIPFPTAPTSPAEAAA